MASLTATRLGSTVVCTVNFVSMDVLIGDIVRFAHYVSLDSTC